MILLGIISLFTSFVPKEITWVALGDSITYLNDHANETSNRVTKGCLTRVTEKLLLFIISTTDIMAGPLAV